MLRAKLLSDQRVQRCFRWEQSSEPQHLQTDNSGKLAARYWLDDVVDDGVANGTTAVPPDTRQPITAVFTHKQQPFYVNATTEFEKCNIVQRCRGNLTANANFLYNVSLNFPRNQISQIPT